jgi:uncharacterized lipoprotein YbaY
MLLMRGFRRHSAIVTIAAIAALGLGPASLSAQQSSLDQVPTAAPSQVPQQAPAPPPHPISRSPLRFALPRREYLCAGGARIVILVETNAVRLTLNDHIYNMKQIEAVSGTKYAESSVVWSSTGEDGFLADQTDPANPKMLAEECHLQSSYPPAAPAVGSIQGTVTFGMHPSLPADSVLIVQLRVLTHDTDDPAAVIAEERIPIGGRVAPISFALRFDPTKIPAKIPSAISASITGRGKLLFVLVKAVTIPDITNPGPVRLALSRAISKTGQTTSPPVPEAPPHF